MHLRLPNAKPEVPIAWTMESNRTNSQPPGASWLCVHGQEVLCLLSHPEWVPQPQPQMLFVQGDQPEAVPGSACSASTGHDSTPAL